MSAAIALLILGLVAAALLFAAVYAFAARPSSREGKRRKQQVVNGFRLAGGILLGIILMGGLVAGALIALGRVPDSRLSAPVASVVATVSFLGIALTVQRWAKYFAGWIAWGVLNSLIMASTGHLLNNPSVPVSRTYALAFGALCLSSVLPSARFADGRKLALIDKVALLAWILAFTASVAFERATIPIMGGGVVALAIAWWLDRRRHDGSRSEPQRLRS